MTGGMPTSARASFLLGSSWLSFFDLVLVNAKKPLFFSAGTNLMYVDTKTGSVEESLLGDPVDYSGGDLITVSRLLGARGLDVVCCGDHLFGDVVGQAQEAVRVAHDAGGPQL